PLVLVLAAFAFRFAGQYHITRLRRLREEVVAVLQGTALLSLCVMATMFLFAGLTAGSILLVRRVGWGLVHTLRSRGYNQTFCLIVGAGRGARRLAGTLQRVSWLGIKNVGFVEERATRLCGDLDVMGGFAELPELIRKY